ncbi:hypothetical protein [Terrarubrum flagellatum]|uniref:hypothetical protein n=1 Tax=Terrirubrum flagellatum TaxID=2895980 RepID=UPI0031456D5A
MRAFPGLAVAALGLAVLSAPSAQALTIAPTVTAVEDAAPVLIEQAQYRRRYYYRPRVVCGVRYRQFYNGLFWQTAPIRVCWRR